MEGEAKKVEVSILVRTRNDAPFIARTLDAIASQKGAPPFEVVVCNDASTDGTTEILAKRSDVRLVERPSGEYFPGRTLNAMVRAARGEIVVFDNADAIPLDDRWLATLIAPLRQAADDLGKGERPRPPAIATFAQQVPRADAQPWVRRDYARAFGDGSVSKSWPRFFSLASSAFRRDWLLENPFDESLLYSEDTELVNRLPIVRRYVPEARVEHSHNYTRREWVRRYYGDGYAEEQIFGDPVPGRLRVAAQAMAEVLRDLRVADGAATAKRSFCLWRRFAQKFAWRRGMADAANGVAPRYRSTGATKAGLKENGGLAVAAFAATNEVGADAPTARPLRFLFTGVYPHLYGGLERFVVRASDTLRAAGCVVDTAGDVPRKLGYYDRVVMQKIPKRLKDLRRLKLRYGDRLRFYVHDHELYCLRRHYYDPMRRVCDRVYSFFPCRACAAVTRPKWVWRALTRDIAGFIREMREVRAFVPTDYMKRNLVKNGFAPERVLRVAPLITDDVRERDDFMPAAADGSRPLRILYAGQLIAGKGVAVLMDAVALLKVPWTLTVVGTGRDDALLKARAAALPAGKVVFTGWQKSVAPYFAASDVVVVPSLWNEPFGTVGSEALAAGTPVIAFTHGGMDDWLVPGETGFAPDSTAPALADALARIADPALLARFSRAGAALVRGRFSSKCFREGFCS